MFLSPRFRNQHREHTIAIIKMRICIQLNPSRNFWVLNLFGPRANKSSFLGLGTFFLTSHKAKDNRQAWKRKSGDFLSDSIYHTSRKVGGNPLISDETCGNVIKRRPVKYFLSYTYLLKAIFWLPELGKYVVRWLLHSCLANNFGSFDITNYPRQLFCKI